MGTERKSVWRRHPVLVWVGGCALVVLAALAVAATVLARRAEPYLRGQIIQALAGRLHARVELDGFHVGLSAGLHGRWGVVAVGRGLRIWPAQQAGAAQALPPTLAVPLIQIDEFSFQAPLHYESGKPIAISRVRLSGLSIHVPPRPPRPQPSGAAPAAQQGSGKAGWLASVVVDTVECDHAQLVLETDKPGKLPMGFAIEHLHLTHITANAPMNFEAQLTNPRPVGVIHTTGSFGPWQADDPGASPVEGTYTFDHADLAAFKGIAGTLDSTGRFAGVLRELTVDGDANVPNFSLEEFGNSLPLRTHFQARVDGTDGDTWLDRVDATLGTSHFTTSGSIVRMKTLLENTGATPSSPEFVRSSPFVGGHELLLDIAIAHQPIESFLRLINRKEKPLLTGIVTVKARLHIPPGKEKVEQRLTLDGSFQLEQAQFTSDKIQAKAEELSLRGQGRPGEMKNADPAEVNSRMQSEFHVAHAVVTLPDLQYEVPGANIQLKGTYGFDGALDFQGSARTQATVSQMMGGWKGFLLKPADRFFQKNGAGASLPIRVTGTRDAPSFGLDLNGIKGGGTHPENPAHPDHPDQTDQQGQPSPQP